MLFHWPGGFAAPQSQAAGDAGPSTVSRTAGSRAGPAPVTLVSLGDRKGGAGVHRARKVLADCKHALDLLETETAPETFRVLWVAGVALARAVGHVLQKVDGERDAGVKKAVSAAYASWKTDRAGNAIFWDFIEEERNQVLKQYEIGFFAGPVDVLATGEVHILDENLFCPLTEGSFAGEDCRDVLEQAIGWWEKQLATIEASLQKSA